MAEHPNPEIRPRKVSVGRGIEIRGTEIMWIVFSLLDVLNGESPALNRPATPELVPGSQWQYSNVAYDVIQLLLEDVSGKLFSR